ncbi:hypothetical protein JTB14_034651 [Gonioctena quinquepunctata]|nr:hypothetical protein JTB14_034651 [Gonioctena quinquepunctata]
MKRNLMENTLKEIHIATPQVFTPPVRTPRKTIKYQQRWLLWIDNIRDIGNLTAANDRIAREIVEKSAQPRETKGPPRAPRPTPRQRNCHNHYDPRAAAFFQKLYRKNEGNYCTIDPDRLVDHFSGAYQLLPENLIPHDVKLPQDPNNEDIDTHFTDNEVMSRLLKTSNSAPGKDGIRYTAIKRLDLGCIVMTGLFDRVLSPKEIPESWRSASIVLILKKGLGMTRTNGGLSRCAHVSINISLPVSQWESHVGPPLTT